MGIKPSDATPALTVKTTAENLADAKSGESYEITTMYPGFIATAKGENEISAMKSFRWAMETEKKHMVMYQRALTAMQAKKTNGLPTLYWVCPKCGNTYDVAKPEASCSFCGTAIAKYIRFGK
jgi:rubrerythrin